LAAIGKPMLPSPMKPMRAIVSSSLVDCDGVVIADVSNEKDLSGHG
jgi:hypothetical protein